MVGAEVEFDELLVCEPPAPLEPQPVSIARISNTPVQDTVFINISRCEIFQGGSASGSVRGMLLDSILESFTFETIARDVSNQIGSY
jgi:hypothetical protein